MRSTALRQLARVISLGLVLTIPGLAGDAHAASPPVGETAPEVASQPGPTPEPEPSAGATSTATTQNEVSGTGETTTPVESTATDEAVRPPPQVVEQEEEEIVDFEAEETESDRQTQRIIAAAGGTPSHGHSGGTGFKLFLDLLAELQFGNKNQRRFEFRPNHFYVLLQAQLRDEIALTLHISERPHFFELTWNITPRFAIKAGKLLVPFGINEFHHLFGGRVDEQSHFLPETWGDFGLGVTHVFYDGDFFNGEYTLYAVNGFEGIDEPIIGTGDETDNNMFKGLGARLRLSFLGKINVTGSFYFDVWDSKDKYKLIFYAAGLELSPGLIDVPVLRKIRIRGEFGRGEIELPDFNSQQGLMAHAYSRGAYWAEIQYPILDNLLARVRGGRINPDNRITDEADIHMIEPAVLLSMGKITFTVAYQMLIQVDRPYRYWKNPPDVIYAKFFVQL